MSKKPMKKTLFNTMLPNPIRERARFNMTLGSFVKALHRERKGLLVQTTAGESVGKAYGYTGYQGDLTFIVDPVPVTVTELIEFCDELMNRTLQGPEGEAIINHKTPLWVCQPNAAIGKPILDVIADAGVIKIVLGHFGQVPS